MKDKESQIKTLLVEDNELNCKMVEILLQQLGLGCDFAENGLAAVELTRKALEEGKPYGLILMDYRMPVMDGAEATRTIREFGDEYGRKVPIIAMTGDDDAETIQTLLTAGVLDILKKPVTVDGLYEILAEYVDRDLEKPEEPVNLEEGAKDYPFYGQELPGFDKHKGMQYSGSAALYQRYLVDFYRLIDVRANSLEDHFREQDLELLTIEIHGLKSNAKALGNRQLYLKCCDIETLGRAGDLQGVAELMPDFLKDYRYCKEILAPIAVKQTSDREISTKEMIRLLKDLHTCADRFDLETADQTMEILDLYKYEPELQTRIDTIGTLLTDVRLEELLSQVDTLIRELEEA